MRMRRSGRDRKQWAE